MYHSPPPCRLASGHECRPVPFHRDRAKVRDYLAGGGADYVVLDEWGARYPGGPGALADEILLPVVAAFPDSFEEVYRLGDGARVLRVRR